MALTTLHRTPRNEVADRRAGPDPERHRAPQTIVVDTVEQLHALTSSRFRPQQGEGKVIIRTRSHEVKEHLRWLAKQGHPFFTADDQTASVRERTQGQLALERYIDGLEKELPSLRHGEHLQLVIPAEADVDARNRTRIEELLNAFPGGLRLRGNPPPELRWRAAADVIDLGTSPHARVPPARRERQLQAVKPAGKEHPQGTWGIRHVRSWMRKAWNSVMQPAEPPPRAPQRRVRWNAGITTDRNGRGLSRPVGSVTELNGGLAALR